MKKLIVGLLFMALSQSVLADGKASIHGKALTDEDLTELGFVDRKVELLGLKSVRPSQAFIDEVKNKANATRYRLSVEEVLGIANKHDYIKYSDAADGTWGVYGKNLWDLANDVYVNGFSLSAKYLENLFDNPREVEVEFIKGGYSRVYGDEQIILCKPTNMTRWDFRKLFRYLDLHSFEADIEKKYLEQLIKVEADCFGLKISTMKIKLKLSDSKGFMKVGLEESNIRIQDYLSDHHGAPWFNIDLNIDSDSMIYRKRAVFPTITINSYQVNELE